MDAFSLALGLGLQGVSLGYELKLSAAVALFHLIMPLIGLYAGTVAGRFLGVWAQGLGALILVYIGGSFLLKGYREIRAQPRITAETAQPRPARTGSYGNILLLSCSVSVDALSVGFGLGTFQMPLLLTVLTMGVVAGLLTQLGFIGGRLCGRMMGSYAQMVGGLVLIALAVKLLFF